VTLAGVALGLPVYHIMEAEIMAQVDPAVFKERLALIEIALDIEKSLASSMKYGVR